MPRTSNLTPTRHPEVPADAELARRAALCTMPRLEGKADDEVIHYGASPHVFGEWELCRGPHLLKRGTRDFRMYLSGIRSVDTLLGRVINVLQDDRLTTADAVTFCQVLQTLYSPSSALPPITQAVAAFDERNAGWEDR